MSAKTPTKSFVTESVNNILNSLKSKNIDSEKESEKSKNEKKTSVETVVVPRGRPKSGKIWKTPKKKFSTLKKAKGAYYKTLEEKQKLRRELKETKETSIAIREQKKADKEALKERRRANLKRAEENRKKAEIVQVITNSAKLKRMKKKQLRFIEKRDTAKVGK